MFLIYLSNLGTCARCITYTNSSPARPLPLPRSTLTPAAPLLPPTLPTLCPCTPLVLAAPLAQLASQPPAASPPTVPARPWPSLAPALPASSVSLPSSCKRARLAHGSDKSRRTVLLFRAGMSVVHDDGIGDEWWSGESSVAMFCGLIMVFFALSSGKCGCPISYCTARPLRGEDGSGIRYL